MGVTADHGRDHHGLGAHENIADTPPVGFAPGHLMFIISRKWYNMQLRAPEPGSYTTASPAGPRSCLRNHWLRANTPTEPR